MASASARACSVDAVRAIARHSCARRRYSSALVRVTADTPIGHLPYQPSEEDTVPKLGHLEIQLRTKASELGHYPPPKCCTCAALAAGRMPPHGRLLKRPRQPRRLC